MCRDGELGKEDVPAWTRNASEGIWQQVMGDVEASSMYTKNSMWKNTDVLRQ